MDIIYWIMIITVSALTGMLVIRWSKMEPFFQGLSVGLVIAMCITIVGIAWVDSLPLCRVIANESIYVSQESTSCLNPDQEVPELRFEIREGTNRTF